MNKIESWYEVSTTLSWTGLKIVALVRARTLADALTRLRADDPVWDKRYAYRSHQIDVERCRCRPAKSLYFKVMERA